MIARAETLRTARMVLRRIRADDVEAVHAIMSDARAMRFWSTPPHATREDTERFVAAMLAAPADASDEFVLEHAGEAVGKLGAWRLPEIGFFLRPDLWGRGFAAEALEAFMAYIAARGVTALTADVDPLNAACLRLLEPAGFRETGRAAATYVLGDRVCDSVYLRLDLPAG